MTLYIETGFYFATLGNFNVLSSQLYQLKKNEFKFIFYSANKQKKNVPYHRHVLIEWNIQILHFQ